MEVPLVERTLGCGTPRPHLTLNGLETQGSGEFAPGSQLCLATSNQQPSRVLRRVAAVGGDQLVLVIATIP